jgi:hypothetical protein
MSEPTNCPKCGAEPVRLLPNGNIKYACGSVSFGHGVVRAEEGVLCLRRQLAAVKKQRDDFFSSEEVLHADLASAFNWKLEGEDFAVAVRRVVKELAAMKAANEELTLRRSETAAMCEQLKAELAAMRKAIP